MFHELWTKIKGHVERVYLKHKRFTSIHIFCVVMLGLKFTVLLLSILTSTWNKRNYLTVVDVIQTGKKTLQYVILGNHLSTHYIICHSVMKIHQAVYYKLQLFLSLFFFGYYHLFDPFTKACTFSMLYTKLHLSIFP